ncbi:hypothetical protein [Rhizomicrobium electricum]|uniref:Uncharacterized protein n=1 Tax=Rhizomicrobium electricum TaxID=480070 RepID=A0ABN1F6D8_9PROT|nr:hypothetical protein [Rhizomicrobium electricum]NIJ50453.1 hypothetical protein [Rhizomicrobium electricum]
MPSVAKRSVVRTVLPAQAKDGWSTHCPFRNSPREARASKIEIESFQTTHFQNPISENVKSIRRFPAQVPDAARQSLYDAMHTNGTQAARASRIEIESFQTTRARKRDCDA